MLSMKAREQATRRTPPGKGVVLADSKWTREDYLELARQFIDADTYEPLYYAFNKNGQPKVWQSFVDTQLLSEPTIQGGGVYWDTQRMHAFMWAAGRASNWKIQNTNSFFPFSSRKRLRDPKKDLKLVCLIAWVNRLEETCGALKQREQGYINVGSNEIKVTDASYDLAIFVHLIMCSESSDRMHEMCDYKYIETFLKPQPTQKHFKSMAEQVLAHLVCPAWFNKSFDGRFETNSVINSMNSREKKWLEMVLQKCVPNFDIEHPNWKEINQLTTEQLIKDRIKANKTSS